MGRVARAVGHGVFVLALILLCDHPALAAPGEGAATSDADSSPPTVRSRRKPPETAPATGEQAPSEAEERGVRWIPLPAISYTPETSLLLGAVSIFTFHLVEPPPNAIEQLRRSSLQLLAAFTLRRQYLASAKPVLYFDGNEWQLKGFWQAQWFPDTFWGIGNDMPESADEDFTARHFGAETMLNRRIVSDLRFGAMTDVRDRRIVRHETGGLIDTDTVPGSDGSRLVGIGPTLIWDGRDTDFSTRRGGRYELTSVFYSSALGSEYGFASLVLDLRQFVPLWGAHVFAAQLYAKVVTDGAPFTALALLGGAERMRGFYEGRYRDRQMVETQIEYRLPLIGPLGAALFVGAGDVAPRMDAYQWRDIKVAGGSGLRLELESREHVSARLDAAATNRGHFNVYVELNEAF
jgi:hypothetical protein